MWTFRSRNRARILKWKHFRQKTNKQNIHPHNRWWPKKGCCFFRHFYIPILSKDSQRRKTTWTLSFCRRQDFDWRTLILDRICVPSRFRYICVYMLYVPIYMRGYAFRYILKVSDILYIRKKKKFKLEQKSLQNKSEISDVFCRVFVPTYSVYLSWGVAKKVFFQTARYTYSVFVGKCDKINNIFPNGVWVSPFGKKIIFLLHLAANMHCKLEQKNLQSKSEICDLFWERFLFQIRVYFVVYNKSEISNIFWTNFVIN